MHKRHYGDGMAKVYPRSEPQQSLWERTVNIKAGSLQNSTGGHSEALA